MINKKPSLHIRKSTLIVLIFLLFHIPLSAQTRTIHVFVALCDNLNQGIVRVPESLGNGQKPSTNLYWGAAYGVKNYFHRKSPEWSLVKVTKDPVAQILERVLFKHKSQDVYLLAEAYDGAAIKQAITDFLSASSGENPMAIRSDSTIIKFGGDADLLAFVGHNGLMEFDLDRAFEPQDSKKRQAIILACLSKDYFTHYLRQTGAYPLLWTTGLMAPEAYTVEWAVNKWISGDTNEQIRQKAAEAYHQYQKCGINGAKRLLVTGW